jgi:hypothetical protein
MNKRITLIALLIFSFLVNMATAQNFLAIDEVKNSKRDTRIFNIESLDKKNVKIKIAPDYINKILTISSLKDTINIYNYWGVPPAVKILNRNFIEIKYEVRGGSNLGLGNMLILCVNGNMLHEAIHVLRYCSYQSYDKSEYEIKVALNGISKPSYRLNVKIHDDAYSKSNPETNYNYDNQTVLSFDTISNVFYSIKENIFGQHAMIKSREKDKQEIKDNLPVIILGKETYYFLKNRWYQLGADNLMREFE